VSVKAHNDGNHRDSCCHDWLDMTLDLIYGNTWRVCVACKRGVYRMWLPLWLHVRRSVTFIYCIETIGTLLRKRYVFTARQHSLPCRAL